MVTTTNVLLGVGGAIAVAGVVQVIIAKKRAKKETMAVLPFLSPTAAGGAVTWRF